jgi:nitronate monooxygenase
MTTITTKLTDLLGITHPIVQGGMGWVGCELAAAVSNAGGLGMICAGSHAQEGGLEGLRALVRKCKALTSKPFGVNFLLLNDSADWMATAELLIEEGVKVVETAGRPPPKELLKRFQDAGIKVIHKCVTIRHSLAAQRLGVDAVEIAGFDLGGHPGEKDVGNWVLLAKAGKSLTIPWIAAGCMLLFEALPLAALFLLQRS